MIILSVPETTDIGPVIAGTGLMQFSPFEAYEYEVNDWIQNLHQEEEFALHRECASYEPSEDIMYEIIKRRGLSSIHVKNTIGLTAFEYLQKNPYTDINEQKLIKRLVLDLMGELIT